ncbi:MAG: hypothetical protein QGG40_17770 [Myxococcota bacterium]|nr:hypothetical protein [Myxococcota bacterium]
MLPAWGCGGMGLQMLYPFDTGLGSDTGPGVTDTGSGVGAETGEPDTDTDTDTDSGSSSEDDTASDWAEGLTGGIIELALTQIACPDCVGATSDLEVTATAAFHEPTAETWVDWLPPSGSCDTSPASNPPTTSYLDLGEWVYLTSGSTSLGLHRTEAGNPTYEASGLGNDEFLRTAYYDLTVPEDEDWASFEVEDAVLTPQSFTDIAPAALLLTNPSAAFSAQISRTGQQFTWAPSGGTGSFVILLEVYSSNGLVLLGQVLCLDDDNGAMTVPASALSAFPTNSMVVVGLYRYQVESVQLPSNGSSAQAVARIGVIGTGVIRQ